MRSDRRATIADPTGPTAALERKHAKHRRAGVSGTHTFFGGFELGPDGLQVGYHLSAVQWREGRRELLLAGAV